MLIKTFKESLRTPMIFHLAASEACLLIAHKIRRHQRAKSNSFTFFAHSELNIAQGECPPANLSHLMMVY